MEPIVGFWPPPFQYSLIFFADAVTKLSIFFMRNGYWIGVYECLSTSGDGDFACFLMVLVMIICKKIFLGSFLLLQGNLFPIKNKMKALALFRLLLLSSMSL